MCLNQLNQTRGFAANYGRAKFLRYPLVHFVAVKPIDSIPQISDNYNEKEKSEKGCGHEE
jgi:hypothetical protein